jgi:hypothetical protein
MTTSSQPGENEQNRLSERFVRWQGYLRQNLSSHIALIVSWSAGGLAFCGALLNNDHAKFGIVTTAFFLATGASFILCLLSSLFISWNRLEDTRTTLKKLKAEKDEKQQEKIEVLKAVSDRLGETTWNVVKIQLLLFAVALFLLAVTVLLAFKDRLDTGS